VVARSIFLEIFKVFGGFLIRAEILSLAVFRRAQPGLGFQQFGGVKLGIWTSNFREGFYLP
jgi:hypothetical protein